jgi:heterotetrameric sarcosine oxidase gamma subunit
VTESHLQIIRFAPRSVSLVQIHGSHRDQAGFLEAEFGADDTESSVTAGLRAYAIGPTEWLLINYTLDDVRRRLNTGIGRVSVRITDVSAAFAGLRIEGAAAPAVLASDIGSPRVVDFASSDHYVRTRLGQIEVVLHCRGPATFEIYVDRSLAEHLEGWLLTQYQARFAVSSPTSH